MCPLLYFFVAPMQLQAPNRHSKLARHAAAPRNRCTRCMAMAERPQERCKTAAAQQAAAEAAVTPDTSLPPRPPLLPASTAKIVVWQAILPSSGPACHLHEALRHLCPERFPSTTSAKRAVRRSEVLLDGGRVIDPSRRVCGGCLPALQQQHGCWVAAARIAPVSPCRLTWHPPLAPCPCLPTSPVQHAGRRRDAAGGRS